MDAVRGHNTEAKGEEMTDLTDAELEALGRCADAACEFADALPSHTSLTTPSCLAQAWMHFQRLAKAYRAGYDAAVRAEREKNAARLGQAERVAEAAREVADDEAKCRYDHNDFCQAHYSSRPCREEVLRDALAAWEAGK